MRHLVFFLAVIILLPAGSCLDQQTVDPKAGSSLTGRIISVIDGDTYDLLVEGNGTVRVRMQGIDAPERDMPFYRTSRSYLSQLCFGKKVTVKVTGTDRGGRTLGFTYLDDGRELCQEMVRAGYAWHFKRYSSDRELSALEKEARSAHRGLWADTDPQPPWEYRKEMFDERQKTSGQ
ncbi:MAG: thermonuclease family protein [Bacteroidales bacterium]|nr:thermonuclease family protein [Lentimicrobiaceae bacterium]MDD5695289.1 thermonuclease family protein [Bacteroidales bacterium]